MREPRRRSAPSQCLEEQNQPSAGGVPGSKDRLVPRLPYGAHAPAKRPARQGEPDAAKVCAASPSDEIPAAGRRGSEDMTSGSTAYSGPKDQTDRSSASI